MRIYHPEHQPSWWERALDLFSGVTVRPRPEGVDYGLLNRNAAAVARSFLDGTFSVCLLGDEMIRADSSWRLPVEAEAARSAGEAVAERVRFGQTLAGGRRIGIPARWFEFTDVPHGTRLLIRLVQRPDPGLRSFLAGSLDDEPGRTWTEYAVGVD
jgi:hypothetical protein